jgi:hypothetical protein
MVAIVNRRALVMGSIISSTLCSSSVLVEDVVKFIATSSPRAFREAVAQQGTFLYRGEPETNAMAGQVCSPEPDLLLERTYNDVKALEYFQCLEEYLASQQVIAKPSTGHIGTSNKRNAQEWGNVVSVWPLGTDLSYVYPKRRREFFSSSNSFCRDEEFCINQNLERALQASWYGSTMNVPTSSFLAVPQKYDKRLEGLLESINYGLN